MGRLIYVSRKQYDGVIFEDISMRFNDFLLKKEQPLLFDVLSGKVEPINLGDFNTLLSIKLNPYLVSDIRIEKQFYFYDLVRNTSRDRPIFLRMLKAVFSHCEQPISVKDIEKVYGQACEGNHSAVMVIMEKAFPHALTFSADYGFGLFAGRKTDECASFIRELGDLYASLPVALEQAPMSSNGLGIGPSNNSL